MDQRKNEMQEEPDNMKMGLKEEHAKETSELNVKADAIPLVNCPACYNIVSSQAVSCPHCGHPLQEALSSSVNEKTVLPTKQGIGFWGVFFAIILAILVMSLV